MKSIKKALEEDVLTRERANNYIIPFFNTPGLGLDFL